MSTPVLELPPSRSYLLARGLIGLLEVDELVTYSETLPLVDAPGKVAAVLGSWPDAPDRLASFTPYGVGDDFSQPQSQVGIQIRMRYAGRNPRAVQNLSDAVFDALHGLSYVTLPTGVTMSACSRRSGASMGQDSAGRWAWSSNYYCDVHWPSQNRD